MGILKKLLRKKKSGSSYQFPIVKREFSGKGQYKEALTCKAFHKDVDIITSGNYLPICAETSKKDGFCDDRYCIWSMAVALGVDVRIESSKEDKWYLRDTGFWSLAPFWIIDWCETAWDPSVEFWPFGTKTVTFDLSDTQSDNFKMIEKAITDAASSSVSAGRLSFFEIGSIGFAGDNREPCEIPKIYLWARKCLDRYPDVLYWMGPATMSWFLGCVRPQNLQRQQGAGLHLKLEATDLTEIVEIGYSTAIERLRNLSAPDEIISRLCLSSNHKLAWALCKGRPPITSMRQVSERHCPSCENILPADAIRCNKCGHKFM